MEKHMRLAAWDRFPKHNITYVRIDTGSEIKAYLCSKTHTFKHIYFKFKGYGNKRHLCVDDASGNIVDLVHEHFEDRVSEKFQQLLLDQKILYYSWTDHCDVRVKFNACRNSMYIHDYISFSLTRGVLVGAVLQVFERNFDAAQFHPRFYTKKPNDDPESLIADREARLASLTHFSAPDELTIWVHTPGGPWSMEDEGQRWLFVKTPGNEEHKFEGRKFFVFALTPQLTVGMVKERV
jgi:hypothetical protein